MPLSPKQKWDESFSLDYVYRKMSIDHPEMVNPVRAKNHKDRRVDWLSYNNIMKWNDGAKQFLVETGMAKDEPGMISKYHVFFHHRPLSSTKISLSHIILSTDGVQLNISLIHPDDANWFITLDETHHEFSTKDNKGGSSAV